MGRSVKARIAGLTVLGGILLGASVQFRHGDGSLVWGAMCDALAKAPGLALPICSILLALALLAWFSPRVASHVMRALFVAVFAAGIIWNWISFDANNDKEPYCLAPRETHTLLAHAENSPSEYERTHLAFYLFLKSVVAGKTVIVESKDILEPHYLTRVARAKGIHIETSPITWPSEEFAHLDNRPHVIRRDGRGRDWTIFTQSNDAKPYRALRHEDHWYLMPAEWVQH